MTLERRHIANGDNLRMPTDIPTACGALKLAAAFAAGTAVIPAGYAVRRGGAVFYRALAGDVYNATIVAVNTDSSVVLDVIMPGCAEPVRLSNIEIRS